MTRLLLLVLLACTENGMGEERGHPFIPNVAPPVIGGSEGSSAPVDAGVPTADVLIFDAGAHRDVLTLSDATPL